MAQCGYGNSEQRDIPTVVEGLANVCKVACGDNHSLCVLATGELFTFGQVQINNQPLFVICVLLMVICYF